MEYTEITSRKNSNVLFAACLQDKKYRDKESLFVFEGHKLLKEALNSDVFVFALYFTSRALQKFEGIIASGYKKGAKLFLVADSVYEKLSCEKSPEGILTVAFYKKHGSVPDFQSDKGVVFLDGIQNPSNLGTIIRSADALGNYDIVYTSDCADIYSPKTVRASMGAVFRTNFFKCENIEDCFSAIKKSGKKVFGTVLSDKAVDIKCVSMSANDCLVIGSEGNGISSQVQDLCDFHVIIPMKNNAESLNAAAACAIFIWEANRD